MTLLALLAWEDLANYLNHIFTATATNVSALLHALSHVNVKFSPAGNQPFSLSKAFLLVRGSRAFVGSISFPRPGKERAEKK
jgi:hypothetical protein